MEGFCRYFGKEKSKRRYYKILKQKNVFIYPGADRSGLLKCQEIVCDLGYNQLDHQTLVVSLCENLSENEVKEN